jgi:hypothetical protein
MPPGRDVLRGAWNALARRRPLWRFAVKACVFIIVLLAVLFPNPVQLARQLGRYRDPEALIITDFPAMAVIDADLNARLTDQPDADELRTVEAYVLEAIPYEWDWNNWGNVDYWPDAAEVWQRRREDCDGRAILAASILRRRGHANARLAGNLQHIWVEVDGVGILGPQGESNFDMTDGVLNYHLPSPGLVVRNLGYGLANYSGGRLVVVLLTGLVLVFHPCRDRGRLLVAVAVGLVGLVLLRDWGRGMRDDLNLLSLNFFGGLLLTGGALVYAGLADRLSRIRAA